MKRCTEIDDHHVRDRVTCPACRPGRIASLRNIRHKWILVVCAIMLADAWTHGGLMEPTYW